MDQDTWMKILIRNSVVLDQLSNPFYRRKVMKQPLAFVWEFYRDFHEKICVHKIVYIFYIPRIQWLSLRTTHDLFLNKSTCVICEHVLFFHAIMEHAQKTTRHQTSLSCKTKWRRNWWANATKQAERGIRLTRLKCCYCSEKSYRHVHCPCKRYTGRATSGKVEIKHWKRSQLLSTDQIGTFSEDDEVIIY